MCSKSSPLGALPDKWKLIPLKDIATKIGSGATPRGGSKVYLPERQNHALVRSQNVFDRSFDKDGLVFISNEHAEKLKNVALQPRDILLNITGDGITFGRACIVPLSVIPACVNQHVSIIRTNHAVCLPEYLISYLTHPAIKEYIESFNAGGSRRAITKGHIESFQIPLPPLTQQEAIAHILGSLDDKIELNRQMNETLEGMAQALFKSWFVDFDPVIDNAIVAGNEIPDELKARAVMRRGMGCDRKSLGKALQEQFPSSFRYNDELGWVPEGWSTGQISQLCEKIQNGGTPKKDIAEYWDEGNIPWLTSGEVRQTIIKETEKKITELGLKKSSAKWVPAGSTVVAMYGATAGQVAFIASNTTTNQAICSLIPKENFRYFNYLALERVVQDLAYQARGSAQQNISKGIVETTDTIIPSVVIAEQLELNCSRIFDKWIRNIGTQGGE